MLDRGQVFHVPQGGDHWNVEDLTPVETSTTGGTRKTDPVRAALAKKALRASFLKPGAKIRAPGLRTAHTRNALGRPGPLAGVRRGLRKTLYVGALPRARACNCGSQLFPNRLEQRVRDPAADENEPFDPYPAGAGDEQGRGPSDEQSRENVRRVVQPERDPVEPDQRCRRQEHEAATARKGKHRERD